MDDDDYGDEDHRIRFIVMARSQISRRESPCRDDKGVRYFDSEEESEAYAAECRKLMGINYHYWSEQV